MAAVGGYTSVLELKPEAAGFNEANRLLKELYENLKNIKDLAGNLNNMKLTIKLDNGEISKASQAAQEEKKRRAEENRILREEKEHFRTHGGTLNVPGRAKVMDTDVEKEKYDKAHKATDMLKDFASMLKWTIGVLASFKGALEIAKAISNNASTQASVSNQSELFGMDAMAMLTLRRISAIYSPSHERTGFDSALTKLLQFKTDPALRGKLDSGLALDLSTGLGTEITSDMFNGKESTQAILFRIFKGYFSKQKGSQSDKDKANMALESLTGSGGREIAQMLKSRGLDLESAFNQNYGLTTDTASGMKNVSIEFGRVGEDFQQIWDSFMSKLGRNLLDPISKVSSWLESNKGAIENFTSFLANVFTLNFEGIGQNIKKSKEAVEQKRQKNILNQGFSSIEEYEKYKSLGLISDTTFDINGETFFTTKKDSLFSSGVKNLDKKELDRIRTEGNRLGKLKGLSSVVGSSFNQDDVSGTQNNLINSLVNSFKFGSIKIDELNKMLKDDTRIKDFKNSGNTKGYDSALRETILKFVDKFSNMKGEVDINIHNPDGTTQKQKISLQKSQSMQRDNRAAGNYEMTGSGIFA